MNGHSELSSTWAAVFSLLFATAVLLVGIGLFFTALGLRAGIAQFSTVATGLVMSAYFAGFILGTYICPALIRRAEHIRAFAAMASIASTTAIVHAMVLDAWTWSLLRLIAGVCMVGLYMVMESWLNALAPNAARGRIFGAYMAVTLLSMGMGQFLVLAGDVVGFVPLGFVSILLSLSLVPVAFTRTPEPRPVTVAKMSLGRLYRISPFGFAAALASGLLNSALFGMGAVFGQRMGLSEGGVAAFMGATIFGGALLQWPIGHASDRYDRRRVLAVVCAAAAILALGLRALSDVSTGWLIACAFLYGGLVFTIYGLSVALVNDRIGRDEVLEVASSLLLVHGIGAAAGPALAGSFMDLFGPGSLLLYFAFVLAAVAAFAVWRLHAAPAVPIEQQQVYVAMASSSPVVLEMDPRSRERDTRPGNL
ncbi:MAG: MFS transporter [Betaproteobacteria bacterium]